MRTKFLFNFGYFPLDDWDDVYFIGVNEGAITLSLYQNIFTFLTFKVNVSEQELLDLVDGDLSPEQLLDKLQAESEPLITSFPGNVIENAVIEVDEWLYKPFWLADPERTVEYRSAIL